MVVVEIYCPLAESLQVCTTIMSNDRAIAS
jgi:hypothetical protein